LRVIGLIVFSSAFLARVLSGLNLVAAQAGAITGSAEAVSQSGQSPSPQAVIRITVNLVQVDAVVTDSKGHQVTNLGPADFEILEDGRPQTITNFSYIFTVKPAGIEAHAAAPPAREEDLNLNNLTFVTVLFDRDGRCVMGKEKRVEFRARDAALARLMQTGITLNVEFDLTPGTYLVRQVVRDSEAGQLSGLNRTVKIRY
jgi:hypothetical protein